MRPRLPIAISRKAQKLHTHQAELKFANAILAGSVKPHEYINYQAALDLVRSEAAMVGITPSDRLLFIGCGPFPISAILYAQVIGCSVTACDVNREACLSAITVVPTFGLVGKLAVIRAAGSTIPVGGYAVIVVALEAVPKLPILDHLAQQSHPGARLILRRSNGERERLFPTNPQSMKLLDRNFRLVGNCTVNNLDVVSYGYEKQ